MRDRARRETNAASVAGVESMVSTMSKAEPLQLAQTARQPALATTAVLLSRLAVRSLYQELALYPKPGLVSLIDNGSHDDMDATTFMRSLFSLRRYFHDIALAGAAGADFAVLRELGIAAERRMLRATGGINTHRGAIFSLGLLCAAAAAVLTTPACATPAAVRATLQQRWGDALRAHQPRGSSHGARVMQRYAAGGARLEAAEGFPAIFTLALPRLQASLAAGRSLRCARIDALFALMAEVADTNVYHRGGAEGAQRVRQMATAFLQAGGTADADWQHRALACHHDFIARRLSPGGAADLLAATCFVHGLVTLPAAQARTA